MAEKNDVQRQYKTAWHPLLVFTIERFAPADRQVLVEFSLNRLPQRVDIVLIEQRDVPALPARKLRSIFDHLRKHTLIEYKGVTDDLDRSDVLVLLAYAGQYMAMQEVFDPEDMCLMVVADRIPAVFVEQVERLAGTFEAVGKGLWCGRLAGLPLHGVELREAYKTGSSERLLYLFTREFLNDPRALIRLKELDEEDIRMYRLLHRHVQQFRRNPMTMDLKDLDTAEKRLRTAYEEIADELTPEEHLARLTIEQRFLGLTPEQRFAGLAPEQRFAGLTPEQIAAARPPEALEFIARKLKE
jgi:hypothetical protein